MSSPPIATLLAVTLMMGACGQFDAFGPNRSTYEQDDSELRHGELRVTLTVTPEALDAPGTVVAALTYENLGSETVVLSSAYGCVAFASVYLGDDRIPFPSTQYGCTAAISYREIAPGVPLIMQWPLTFGGENGMNVPEGTYRFVAELNTGTERLERAFVVR